MTYRQLLLQITGDKQIDLDADVTVCLTEEKEDSFAIRKLIKVAYREGRLNLHLDQNYVVL